MPKLSCGVNNCGNNSESMCALNSIDVSGDQALTSTSTCCSAFTEQTGASNSLQGASAETEVACEACNCAHNESSRCKADTIDIDGMGATNSVDTQCVSFCPS